MIFLRDEDDNFDVKNVLNKANIADQSGIIDIDIAAPYIVPLDATGIILTVERGWLQAPTGGTGSVSLRVMAHGYNLSNMLDLAKSQAWIINGIGVDVVAEQIIMPMAKDRRTFFWALQSSHATEAKKMAIIDLWGYTT